MACGGGDVNARVECRPTHGARSRTCILATCSPFFGDPSTPFLVDWQSPFAVNFVSGGAAVAGAGYNYVKAHGGLMITAWTWMIPFGILMARFGKGLGPIWFQVHRAVQSCALLMVIIGLIIAVEELNATDSTHRELGIATIVMGLSQPVIALFRPHPGTPKRFIFNYIHWSIGYCAVACGIATCFLGVKKAKDRDGYLDVYKSLYRAALGGSIIFAICYAGLETRRRVLGEKASPAPAAPHK
jgi:hypothetical protein